MNSKNPYLLFIVFLLFCSNIAFAQTDTIHIDLDELANSPVMLPVSFTISRKKCGKGWTTIPVLLQATGLSKTYLITHVSDNGNTTAFPFQSDNRVIIPSTGKTTTQWLLRENFLQQNCSLNRQSLLLQLHYYINDTMGQTSSLYEKTVRVHYVYD